MAAARARTAADDPDVPEPLPEQASWSDRTPPVEQKGGLFTTILAVRWTQCVCKLVKPNVAKGREVCPQCGNKPTARGARAVFSSKSREKVAAELARVERLRPQDYFLTEGRHDIDLDA